MSESTVDSLARLALFADLSRPQVDLRRGPAVRRVRDGNLTLVVIDPPGMEFEQRGRNPVALRVDDVLESRKLLEARGVEFNGETIDSGVCHQAFFADPDGNVLVLHHRYTPRAP